MRSSIQLYISIETEYTCGQTRETKMHPINFVATGGQFGTRRLLATFELVPTNGGSFAVWDRQSSYHSPKAYVTSAEQAVRLFGAEDERRTRMY